MPFYNTAQPNPETLNTINNVTLGTYSNSGNIRDFLLYKNIHNFYPRISTAINGSPRGGEPVLDTAVGTNSIIPQISIEISGLKYYDDSIGLNRFKDTDSNAPSLTSIDYILPSPIFPEPNNGSSDYLQEDITTYGLLAKTNYKNYRKVSTLKNLYVDSTKQIDMADYISLQPIVSNTQYTNYVEEYGNLTSNNTAIVQAGNILGSFLNGQGVGFDSSGLVTNFDIRSSLVGRTLTATGVINDTKLGIIGARQLAFLLANNAAFNTEQELVGSLNISDNILSLIKGKGLAGLRPNYSITVPSDANGLLGYAEKILGFYIPRSYLQPQGSIFSTENGNIANIERANAMLENTGKGQVNTLISLMNANVNGISANGIYDNPSNSPFRSGYTPGYSKANKLLINPQLYAFYDNKGNIIDLLNATDGFIPTISYNRSKLIENSGFDGFENNFYPVSHAADATIFPIDFTWTSAVGGNVNSVSNPGVYTGAKKTLLAKTQMLFNSVGMKSIVSTKGDMTIGPKTQIQTSVVQGGISRGSAALSSKNFTIDGALNNIISTGQTADNTFCRSWTPYNRYDTVEKLIRSRGLNQSETNGGKILNNDWRLNYANGSVLDDNGFVKIAPYKTDNLTRGADNPKKYMFSIENLAWVGNPAVNLPAVEQGAGDPLTGKFGRIMWFPPYDLSFNETSSVNLESNLFVGRGEPLYTYNNTERSGSLSFKIIVDHPSIMNAFAGDQSVSEEFIRSWLTGCLDLDNARWANLLTTDEKAYTDTRDAIKANQSTITPVNITPKSFNIYFKNDCTDVDFNYEAFDIGYGIYTSNIPIQYQLQKNGTCTPTNPHETSWVDRYSYSLNSTPITIGTTEYSTGWPTPNFLDDLAAYLNGDDFKNYVINITVAGYASSQGCLQQNLILAQGRRDNTIQYLKQVLGKGINKNINYIATSVANNSVGQKVGGDYTNDPNITPQDQKAPKQDRFASISFSIDYTKTITAQPVNITNNLTNINLNQQIQKRFYNEGIFFEKLKRTDPLVFQKISEKIKFFNPAFHSMTPEGFNSRLTFLLQCTRQGPTNSNIEAQNLAFGPPPVCILRIGDFYNTKIMIDNITFDFQEPQWDLNPEGIGVQPMIASVNMSFKYIGGSSLIGPINKLQNALSFNFFANTQVYDPRADYIAKASDINLNNGTNTLSDKRNTYGTNNLEDNYALVVGMDPSVTPYEKNPSIVPASINNSDSNVDIIKTADKTSDGKKTSLSSSTIDSQVLSLTDVVLTSSSLQFTINSPVNNTLSQDYNVIPIITDVDDTVSYAINNKTANVFANNIRTSGYICSYQSMNIPTTIKSDKKQYKLTLQLCGKTDNAVIKLRGYINK